MSVGLKLVPSEILASAYRNRHLIWKLTQRDVQIRYHGSILGILWSAFHPVLLLLVYTFVFGFVFRMRWGGHAEQPVDFAFVLFAGLIVFNIFAECITRAPNLMLANPSYVKKVVFPLEILPWIPFGSSLFHATVSSGILLAAYLFREGSLHSSSVLGLAVLLPLGLYVLGLTWLLASLGVFYRDIQQVVGVFMTILMFMTPIFYPEHMIPAQFQLIATKLNPLAYLVHFIRQTVLFGAMPEWGWYCFHVLIGGVTAWLGFTWFQMTRKGFADVI